MTRITSDPDGALRTCQFDRGAGAALGGRSHLNGVQWLLADMGATADSVAWVAQQHFWCSTDDLAEGSRCPTRDDAAWPAGAVIGTAVR